jgi:hypothetical protein
MTRFFWHKSAFIGIYWLRIAVIWLRLGSFSDRKSRGAAQNWVRSAKIISARSSFHPTGRYA